MNVKMWNVDVSEYLLFDMRTSSLHNTATLRIHNFREGRRQGLFRMAYNDAIVDLSHMKPLRLHYSESETAMKTRL